LVTLYGKSCDGGDTEDCSYLGNMYENGKGVAKDKTQAVALYRKACDLGDAWGCMKLKDLQP
jgi:TPR repeat protein